MKSARKRATEPQTDEERRATFDREHKIMSMFSDNAKGYIQLSSAALALTMAFAHQILHIPDDKNVANTWMILMWACFLITMINRPSAGVVVPESAVLLCHAAE